ncbi:MAG TPA: carbohydrate ABC transporter permease [Candidatus Merdivicinus excrementipullorum]|uniref:Carbohydrate ABC transporter permease n=1 Tax=Candidatus Merdivicinus excrementipullorum TaxID=2840867 RepID=A0A9D1FL46_9FIRM|nr:carbohydrate ABC transporter permease [Candidatus Merdivicinus excrementipullorum]
MVIKETFSDKVFNFFNVLLTILITLIVLYPLIYILSASFSDPMAVMNGEVLLIPVDFTFAGYQKVFQNEDIVTGYLNSIQYTIVGTAVNLIMTVLGAYPLSRKDFYGRNVLTAFFAFTMFFGGGMIPTYLVIQDLGLLNNFWVMILPGAVSVWSMVIVRTFFQSSIPDELREAAVIDGCSNTRLLMTIILPLSIPVLAVITMQYAVGHWNAYFNALIYITDREKYPLQMVLRELLMQSKMDEMMDTEGAVTQQMLAESLKYAVMVVASVPVLLLYPFLQRYFVKGVMVGAIKG